MNSRPKVEKPEPEHCPACGADRDAAEHKLLADIATYGWHAVGVTEGDHGPPFVYSVGLFRTWRHPEIVVFGLGHDVMHRMISNVVHEINSGEAFSEGDESTQIVQAYKVVFRRADRSHYRDYFGYALWYYQGFGFPVLQCVWPDRFGAYPWDKEFVDVLRWRQTPLWEAVA